ncbi:MAG: hypothetical protein JST54_33200 [Deltaproteobacteria bacterium]|nr:hypothetical protein [Deltaproteobacteria bacterium]
MNAALLALALAATPYVDQCRATLADAEAAPPVSLRAVVLRLPPPTLGDDHGALPALDAALDALSDAPTQPEIDRVLESLRAICRQAARPDAQPATLQPDALKEILSRPQFSQRRGREWALGKLAERLWDVIKELLQQRSVYGYSTIARAVFLIAVALLVLVLGRRVLRGRRAQAPDARRVVPTAFVVREPTVAELESAAQAALARGEAREAVRAQMRAVVAAAAERGFTDRRGVATNRELAKALAARARDTELASKAEALAADFDLAIYGERAIDVAAAERFGRDAAALRARLGSAP